MKVWKSTLEMLHSLNDLEHQVWKSGVLNEADGWWLIEQKPAHQPGFPTSCVVWLVLTIIHKQKSLEEQIHCKK